MSSGFRDRGFGPQGSRYDGPPKDNPNNNRQQQQQQQHNRGNRGPNFNELFHAARRNTRAPVDVWANPNVNGLYNNIQHQAPPVWQPRARFQSNTRPEFRGNVNFQPRGQFPRFNRFQNADSERNFQSGGIRRDFSSRYPFRQSEKKNPSENPGPPPLGSEEERRQKINDAVDELKKKLLSSGTSTNDDAGLWDDDLNVPEPEPSSVDKVSTALPELIHGPPEIALTASDFKDIGRVHVDSGKQHDTTRSEDEIEIVEVPKTKIDIVDVGSSPIASPDNRQECTEKTPEFQQTEELNEVIEKEPSNVINSSEEVTKNITNAAPESETENHEIPEPPSNESPKDEETTQEKLSNLPMAKSSPITASPKSSSNWSSEVREKVKTPRGRKKREAFGWPVEEASPITTSPLNRRVHKTYTPPPPPSENLPQPDLWQPAPAFDPRKPSGDVPTMINDFNTMCSAYAMPMMNPFGMNSGMNSGYLPPYVPPPMSYPYTGPPQNLRAPDLNQIPIPAEPPAGNEDEALNELKKAMEFANELMSIDPEEQDFADDCADGFDNFPTLPDLPPPLPPPPPDSDSPPKTPRSKKKKKKKQRQDLTATVPLPPDTYIPPVEQPPVESSPVAEPVRPKVAFNLPPQTRKLNTSNEWSTDDNTVQRTKPKPNKKTTKSTEEIDKPLDTKSINVMDFLNSIKLDTEPLPSVSQPETVQIPKKTGESSWKDKVIGRFLKMSKNDIKNMINNSNLRKFDIALQQLVKEQKTSLSLEMRNTEDERIKSNINNYDKDEDFIHQLQAILDPAATVDIADLPTNFIHQLNEVLQLDVMPDSSESTITNPTNISDRSAAVVSVSPQHGINAPVISTCDTLKSSYATKIDKRTTKDSTRSIESTTINARKKAAAISDSPITVNSSNDTNHTLVQQTVENPAIIMDELDDIFTAGINRVKMTKHTVNKSHPQFTNQSNIVTGAETPIVDRVDRIFTAGIERAKAAAHKSEEQRLRGRKNSADVDVFRNLTKEEYDARYGGESSSHENPYRIMNPKHLRKHDTVLNGDQISRPVITSPRFSHNSDEGSHNDYDSDDSSSSSISSSASSGEPSIDVSRMLRFIKEREKIAKKKSINEEIRDEVAAEIERKRREKRAHREHRRLKKKDRRRKDKQREKRKRGKKKKKRRHFSEGDARSSYERSPILSENQIKKEPEDEPPAPVTTPQRKKLVGPKSVMMKAGLMPSEDTRNSPRHSPAHSSPNSQSSNHSLNYLKTKAQLKQMPDTVKRTSVRRSVERTETIVPRSIDVVPSVPQIFAGLEVKIKDEPISPPASPKKTVPEAVKKISEIVERVVEPTKFTFSQILEKNQVMEMKAMQFSSSDENSGEKQASRVPVIMDPSPVLTSAISTVSSPAPSPPITSSPSDGRNPLGPKKLDIKAYKERALQRKLRAEGKLPPLPEKPVSVPEKPSALPEQVKTAIPETTIGAQSRLSHEAKRPHDESAVCAPAKSPTRREKIPETAKVLLEAKQNSEATGESKRKRSPSRDVDTYSKSNDVLSPKTSSPPGPLSSKRRRASLEAARREATNAVSEKPQTEEKSSRSSDKQKRKKGSSRSYCYLFNRHPRIKSDGFPDLVPLERIPDVDNSSSVAVSVPEHSEEANDLRIEDKRPPTPLEDGELEEAPKPPAETPSDSPTPDDEVCAPADEIQRSEEVSAPKDLGVVANGDVKSSAALPEESVLEEDVPREPAVPEVATTLDASNLPAESDPVPETSTEPSIDKISDELPQESQNVTCEADFSDRMSKHWRTTSIDTDRLSPEDLVQKEDDQEMPNWQLEAEISSEAQRKNAVLHDRALIVDTPRHSFLDDPIAFATTNNSPSNEPSDEYGMLGVSDAISGSIYVNQLGENPDIDMINDVPIRESYTPDIVSRLGPEVNDLGDQVAMADKDLMEVGKKASPDRLPSPILQEGIHEEESDKVTAKNEEKMEKTAEKDEKSVENKEKLDAQETKSLVHAEEVDQHEELDQSPKTTNNGAFEAEKSINSSIKNVEVPEEPLDEDKSVENYDTPEIPDKSLSPSHHVSPVPELNQIESKSAEESKKLDEDSPKSTEIKPKSPEKIEDANQTSVEKLQEEKDKVTSPSEDTSIKKEATPSPPPEEHPKEREKSVESSSSRASKKHGKETDPLKKLNSSSLPIKQHKKHKHHHEKSSKKSKITEKKVTESIKANLVTAKPTTKNAVMARMREIDIAIQNLMNEKMTLYQMMQNDEWPTIQAEPAVDDAPIVATKSKESVSKKEANNSSEKVVSKKSAKIEAKSIETSKSALETVKEATKPAKSPKTDRPSSWEDKVPHKSAKKRQHKDEIDVSKSKEARKEASADVNTKISDESVKKERKSAKNTEDATKKPVKLSQLINRNFKPKPSQQKSKSVSEEKERDSRQKIGEKSTAAGKLKHLSSSSENISGKLEADATERKTEDKKKKHTTPEQQSLLYSDDSTLDSFDKSSEKKATGLALLEESMKREAGVKKPKDSSKKSKESTPEDDDIELPKTIAKKKHLQKKTQVQVKKSGGETIVDEKSSKTSKKSKLDEKTVEKSEEPKKKSSSVEPEKPSGESKISKKAGSKLSIIDSDTDSGDAKRPEQPKISQSEHGKSEKKPSTDSEKEKDVKTTDIIKPSPTKSELLNDWSDSSSSISSSATKSAKSVQKITKKAPLSKAYISGSDSDSEKPASDVDKQQKSKPSEVKSSKSEKSVKSKSQKAVNEKSKLSLKEFEKKSEKTRSTKDSEKHRSSKAFSRDDDSTVEGDDEDDDSSSRKRGRSKRNNKKSSSRRSNKSASRSRSRVVQSSSRESSPEFERMKKRPRSGSSASSINSRKRSALSKHKVNKTIFVERSREEMMKCTVKLTDCKYLCDLDSEVLFERFGISINSWPSQKLVILSDEKSRSEDESMIVIEADSNVGSSSAVELIETGIEEENDECLGFPSSPRVEELAKEKKEDDLEIIDIKDEPILEDNKEEKVDSPVTKTEESDKPEVSEDISDNDEKPDDLDERRMRYTVHKGPVLDIKVFGDSFLAASEDGAIYRYSQKSNGILNIYQGHEAAVTCLYVHEIPGMAESKKWFLFSGSLDASLRCYDVMGGTLSRPVVTVGSPIQCMDQAWGSIFIGTKSGHISRYDIKSGTLREDKLDFSDKPVLALRASTEGPRKVLIVASRNQPITLRDAHNGLFLRTIAGQRSHTVYSLLRDRNYVYCGTSSTSIPVFDFISGEQISQYTAGVGIVCMQLYRQLLFAGCYDGNIYVFDTEDKRLICSIPGPGNMLLSMEIVDDTIIAGSKDRRLHAWRMPAQVRAILLDRT